MRGDTHSTSRAHNIVETARPKQWLKNLLVFGAPAAAGVLDRFEAVGRTLLTFLAFSFVAAGQYFFNDIADRFADSAHPIKRDRPVASGRLSPAVAAVTGSLSILAGFVGGAFIREPRLLLLLGGYVLLSLSYSWWLKRIAVVEIAAVAGGFLIRAFAGGVANDVPLSFWFIMVTSFASLFIVAGKREVEYAILGEKGPRYRAPLAEYTASFLRQVRTTSAAVTLAVYSLWAFERSDAGARRFWLELSIAPFVLGVLRYMLLIELKRADMPEDVLLGDRQIQVLVILWALCFALGVYAA